MHSTKWIIYHNGSNTATMLVNSLFRTSRCQQSCNAMLLAAKFHRDTTHHKYETNTDLVHAGVTYGFKAYPTRPNDPRVPSNPEFGKIRLSDKPNSSDLSEVDAKKIETKSTISKAMKAYIEQAKKHKEFIDVQEEEFQMGRRHLANMMGINEATMQQNEINVAIRYLMPSGVFDHRARPRMRPPSEIYPNIKEAQFHFNGRPFHSMFYTGRANFYQACYDLEKEMKRLNEYEDEQIRLGITNPQEDSKVNLSATVWLTQLEMKHVFLEKINPDRYEAFINALEKLVEHPYSKLSEQFLMQYRKKVKTAAEMTTIEPLKYDENGRPYMTARGYRKHCVAFVTVRGNGTGKVDINGKDILYFEHIQDREQVMTPLTFTGLLNKVDIEAVTMHEEYTKEWSEDAPPFEENRVRTLGTSTQSGAIRYGLSLALKSFVDRETVEKMRLVGLLTCDQRQKERKKPGQEGARRKFTWKKR